MSKDVSFKKKLDLNFFSCPSTFLKRRPFKNMMSMSLVKKKKKRSKFELLNSYKKHVQHTLINSRWKPTENLDCKVTKKKM
jgi:hypothetical protein